MGFNNLDATVTMCPPNGPVRAIKLGEQRLIASREGILLERHNGVQSSLCRLHARPLGAWPYGPFRPASPGTDASVSLADQALFDYLPVVAVARGVTPGQLPMQSQRYLLAANGLFLQVRRHWIEAILRLSDIPTAVDGLGTVDELIAFRANRDALQGVVRQFAAEAACHLPNEHAGWGVLDTATDEVQYRAVSILERSPSHVRYERPAFRFNAIPFMDIHSHGRWTAHFSDGHEGSDEYDDYHDDIKLAVVIGRTDQPEYEVVARLCGMGGLNRVLTGLLPTTLAHEVSQIA